ncbi:DUF2845 domain-containing protein [Anaeromyxobacter oryzae]|uniref:DUF2845 domain-containing protein n=1 Tax=Anaeromyxobacter oryzae TaxID=2918170 RepID=A0ABM7WNH5_9BACT|nr:DUF2845 domain-containing protein [Anaeromyxobacter oryzae]BDG01016.1 hypothetical protein AMOR_00120 [Anaeromyxobacter oryzae]
MTRTAIALALLLAPLAAHADPSLRCGNRLVSVGDTKLDLLGRCGRPTLSDARDVERTRFATENARHAPGTSVAAVEMVTIEEWSYDPGKSGFVHVVTLEGGRVRAITRLGYGRLPPPDPPAPVPVALCEPSAIGIDDHALDVVGKCGEPATVDRRRERRTAAVHTRHVVEGETVTVEVELWAYNFGPNRLTQLVTIEDGWVVAVEHGGYGY